MKILAVSVPVAALAAAAATLLFGSRTLYPCVQTNGTLIWVRGECPPESIAAAEVLPDACEEGWCAECPPEGCPPLESMVQCCCGSGPGGCFEIIETTMECGLDPSCQVLYCEFGYCDEAGETHCIIE